MNNQQSTPPEVEFVAGQVMALQAVVIALARLTSTPPAFLAEVTRQLEMLRLAALPQPISEQYLHGIDQVEQLIATQVRAR